MLVLPMRSHWEERYWTVVDEELAFVPAADRFIHEERVRQLPGRG